MDVSSCAAAGRSLLPRLLAAVAAAAVLSCGAPAVAAPPTPGATAITVTPPAPIVEDADGFVGDYLEIPDVEGVVYFVDGVKSEPGELWGPEEEGVPLIVTAEAASSEYTFPADATVRWEISFDWTCTEFVPPAVSPFKDVATSNYFYTEIAWMAETGISTGYHDGTYRPLKPINRDAMAAFLYRLAGSPDYTPPAVSRFKDVSTTNYFYKEIAWMAEEGISTGYHDGTFRPLEPINRDAMAAFLYRFDDADDYYRAPRVSPFTDIRTSNFFYTEIAWMEEMGLSTGYDDHTYRPLKPVNRDAMAAFMFRYVQDPYCS